MMNFLLRVLFFAMGLVFAASLAFAVLVIAAAWGLRYAWARLTGRPIQPWVMRFDPRGGFDRFRAAGQRAQEPSAADVAGARARGEASGSPVRLSDPDGITDVQSRPVSPRD